MTATSSAITIITEAHYPPRIERLRQQLCANIPCHPDTKEIREELLSLHLRDILVRYTNWANRVVPKRRRCVSYLPNFWNDCRNLKKASAVLQAAKEIEEGESLLPRLSELIFTHGYVPARYDKFGKRKGPEWEDKDFALNVHDVHHLHLGSAGERTKQLLYIGFTREAATILFVGDHNSFDDGSVLQAAAQWHTGSRNIQTPYDRKDMNRLHRRGISTFNVVDEKIYIGTGIASDGSVTGHWANHIYRVLQREDPTLDDPERQVDLFANSGRVCPDEPEFIWQMNLCDLELIETKSNIGFRSSEWLWRR